MVGVFLFTTVGLVSTVFFVDDSGDPDYWPWATTEVSLLLGICAMSVLLSVYLSKKQHEALFLPRLSQESEKESKRSQRRYHKRLAGLLKVSRILGSLVDLQQVFDGVTQTALEAFNCDQVSLMLLDGATQELEVRSSSGFLGKRHIGSRQKIGQGVAGRVAELKQALILGSVVDPTQFRGFQRKQQKISASMVVPINLRDELIGVLSVSNRSPNCTYEAEDLHVLQVFAEIVTVCIRHAQQAAWMQETILRSNDVLGREAAARNRQERAS